MFPHIVTEVIYIYIVIISVCLFVCPIRTQKPLESLAENFDWGGEPMGTFLAWFYDSKLSERRLYGQIAKIVI